jgi:hypothetical protein
VSAAARTTMVSPAPPRAPWRATYVQVLTWSFAFFNGVRLATYLPTMWAIHQTARSDQHSLLTWASWMLANLTMALWIYERERRVDGLVAVNLGNAAMCAAVTGLIAWYR